MTRAEFDRAMAENDISWLLEHTFLGRVPDLVISGLSLPDAMAKAKADEDSLVEAILWPSNWRDQEAAAELKRLMTERVYNRLRALPAGPLQINPLWLECEAELGRRPLNREFMAWVAARKHNDTAE